jgi:hypothetical protein
MKTIASLLLPVLILTGCVSAPTKSQLSHLDYGAPPKDYEMAIKHYFDGVLIDPDTAYYNFELPRKFWYNDKSFFGGKLSAGYLVRVGVNSKNKYGGYSTEETYGFLMKGEQIIRVLDPDEMLSSDLLYGT